MARTKIEWTRGDDGAEGRTWNPVRGCSRVSEGCRNCYAERMAARLSANGMKPDSPFYGFVTTVNGHPALTGKVDIVEKHLLDPLKWKKPTRVFVNSMSDLFHEGLSGDIIDRVFAVMALCPQHTFQVLTKRSARMMEYLSSQTVQSRITAFQWEIIESRVDPTDRRSDDIRATALDPDEDWPLPNVWMGVSAEDQTTANARIPNLLETPAAIRFVSYEPCLGPIDFMPWLRFEECGGGHRTRSTKLNWLIAGFESGPNARPTDEDWIRDAKDQCVSAGVSFFYKQSAIHGKKIPTPELDGQKWMQFPEVHTHA
jgi:protein gp37